MKIDKKHLFALKMTKDSRKASQSVILVIGIELEHPHHNNMRYAGMASSDKAGSSFFAPTTLQSNRSHSLYVLWGLQELEV